MNGGSLLKYSGHVSINSKNGSLSKSHSRFRHLLQFSVFFLVKILLSIGNKNDLGQTIDMKGPVHKFGMGPR